MNLPTFSPEYATSSPAVRLSDMGLLRRVCRLIASASPFYLYDSVGMVCTVNAGRGCRGGDDRGLARSAPASVTVIRARSSSLPSVATVVTVKAVELVEERSRVGRPASSPLSMNAALAASRRRRTMRKV